MQTILAKQNTETQFSRSSAPAFEHAHSDNRLDHAASLSPGNVNTPSKARAIIETLKRSKIYQEYETAFSETTGLPVSFRAVESWQLPHHGKKHENRFCSLLAGTSRACAACLQVQEKLSQTASIDAQSINCAAGLTDIAIPVRLGEQLIGFLQTGQAFRKKPTENQFQKISKLVQGWGVTASLPELKEAYFSGRVLSSKQHDAVVRLLTIFAQHLSMVSNQLVVQQENAELPVISRAKQFILDNQTEDLSLSQVAKAVNTSTFYFCKLFKKATGLNFTAYLSRVRIEKAKNLLLNPNLRVSEIAFEVGFQSLTHFNRVFKNITGQAPTEYRHNLMRA